jgi:hypothetical protein
MWIPPEVIDPVLLHAPTRKSNPRLSGKMMLIQVIPDLAPQDGCLYR